MCYNTNQVTEPVGQPTERHDNSTNNNQLGGSLSRSRKDPVLTIAKNLEVKTSLADLEAALANAPACGMHSDRPVSVAKKYNRGHKHPEILGQVSLTDTADGRSVKKILVHFKVPKDLIPRGLLPKEHRDQKQVLGSDYGNKIKGKQAIIVYDVQVAFLRKGLANHGWFLAEANYYEKQEDNFSRPGEKRTVYIVCLTYSKSSENPLKLASTTLAGIRGLSNITWSECFVWDNTAKAAEAESISLHCRHSQGSRLRRIVAVRGGNICCLQREQLMPEAQE